MLDKPRDRGICPKCERQACEQFDDKPGPHGTTLAVPNGTFKCYWCGNEFGEEVGDAKP